MAGAGEGDQVQLGDGVGFEQRVAGGEAVDVEGAQPGVHAGLAADAQHDRTRWSVIAQQTLFSPRRYPSGVVSTDSWDGYPGARARLLQSLARHAPRNSVLLGGDIHQKVYAEPGFNDHRENPEDPVAVQYAEVLSRSFALTAFVADRDRILAAAGSGRRDLADRSVSQPLEKVMESRKPYLSEGDPEHVLLPCEGSLRPLLCAWPIIAAGDVTGAVGLLAEDRTQQPDPAQQKAVAVAAAFLAKQMEE